MTEPTPKAIAPKTTIQKHSVMAKTTIESKIRERANWLLSLECSPLPVAPAQSAEKYPQKDKAGNIIKAADGSPKPLFNGKNPSYLDAEGKPHLIKHSQFAKSLPGQADLDKWFANPENNIGTLAGMGGIDWIDLDRKNFDSDEACDTARAKILERCDRTYFEKTKNGGFHIAVKLRKQKDFTNFSIGGSSRHAGEFLGGGRFVVVSPSSGYSSLNGDEIATAESAQSLGLHSLKAKTKEAPEAETAIIHSRPVPLPPLDTKDALPLTEIISASVAQLLKAGKPEHDASAELTKVARELFSCADWYPKQGLALSGNPQTLIEDLAERWGCDGDRLERVLEKIAKTGGKPAFVYSKGGKGKESGIALYEKRRARYFNAPDKSQDKDEDCKELKKIKALRSYYAGRVKFNELAQKIEVDGKAVSDIEGERIAYIEKQNKSVGVDAFCTILRVIATENSYHPVAVYLESVSEKHGKDTTVLDGIAKRYFGVDNPLYSTYLKRWLISAVARIFKPGAKADCALFLQGDQGARKSTFFSMLAGEDFFSDSLGNTENNKDEILLMHRYWIHEWSELETVFRKKEMATVKSFMARRFDTVRPPYRRDLVDLKRRCVFAGTTNENAFLSDNTGDRRFWTIPVKGIIPTELLKEERDRIWAAAVALYNRGEQWYLTELEEAASRELNSQFRSLDPWHSKIQAYIHGKASVSINEILLEFGYELKQIGRKEQLRVSGVLTGMGWKSSTVKKYGKTVRQWVPGIDPIKETLQQLQNVDSWEGYTEISDNCSSDVLNAAWAQLNPDHQQLILALRPQPAALPEVIESDEHIDVAESAIPTQPKFQKNQKVRYVGDRHPALKGSEMSISDLNGENIACKKEDGYITPWLQPSELELVH